MRCPKCSCFIKEGKPCKKCKPQRWTQIKKRCSFCGERKPLARFHLHANNKHSGGVDSRCKECSAIRLGAGRYTPLGKQIPHHDYAKALRRMVGHRVVTDKLRIGTGIGFKGQRAPEFN